MQEFETWELGYVFNNTYQGMGYATESAKAVLKEAFESLGARRVIAMCNPENAPSWRLLDINHIIKSTHGVCLAKMI